MKNLLLLIILYCGLNTRAQNEDRVWYFGPFGAGIDFRSCSAVVKTNGNNASNSFEGCASMCDATTGRLLFYCTETKIFDSTFNQMPNGINVGNGNSGTQSIIVRKPGSNTIFYYFVTDIQGGAITSYTPTAKGLSYCVIDMSLNGGLGSVVSKHNPLKDTSNCEKLMAVRHANGNDIWLIAHEYRTNNFLVYSITNLGINPVPSVQAVGPVITSTQNTTYATSRLDAVGELKASPDGSKLAFTTAYNGITCLFNFNNLTGTISNPIALNLNGKGGYGVSFSPDNSKLYIACLDTTSFIQPVNGQLVQFDLSSNVPATIQGSKIVINNCASCSYRSIKLAPDGKIYCAKIPTIPESYTLAVINSPNNVGLTCNYMHNGLYLGGLFCTWGLNNIMETNNVCCVAPNLTVSTSASTICAGAVATLSCSGAITFSWSNGGVGPTTTVNPAATTIYTVTGYINSSCSTKVVITQNVKTCAGISENNESKIGLIISPNPSHGFVKLNSTEPLKQIEIFDQLGRRVYFLLPENLEVTLQMAHPGVFYLKATFEEGVIVKKIIVAGAR